MAGSAVHIRFGSWRCRIELEVPPDGLIVLIGPAGCGKSTFAHRHFRPTEVVSSDECRALVSDDEADPRASRDAFEVMHCIIDKRLKRGHLTVADATNVRADKRADLVAIARRHRRPAAAIVFDLPDETCQKRNRGRQGRRVPPAAIRAHARLLRDSLATLADEGFVVGHVLRSAAETDEATVIRARSRAAT